MSSSYKSFFHRCQEEAHQLRSSWFDTQMLCPACWAEEASHSLYEHAQRVAFAKIQIGDYKFTGIGLPEDLQRKYLAQ